MKSSLNIGRSFVLLAIPWLASSFPRPAVAAPPMPIAEVDANARGFHLAGTPERTLPVPDARRIVAAPVIPRERRDTAKELPQLLQQGTSDSGNHFVEFGAQRHGRYATAHATSPASPADARPDRSRIGAGIFRR